MATLVTCELHDSIAAISMDDGKVNVMSSPMLAELNAALDLAEQQHCAVLLSGRTGMFSAGFDLKVLKAGGPPAHDMFRSGFELAERLLAFPTPIMIACTGHALAMGSFLLLSADYRIGVDGPFRIGANEVAIGLTLPRFAIELCRQRLSTTHFSRATLNAEIYAPHDAVHAGFLDRVVPAADLPAVAQQEATRLSRLDMPAYAATKQRARADMLQSMRAAIEADVAAFRARG